jgi:hypothetical protein
VSCPAKRETGVSEPKLRMLRLRIAYTLTLVVAVSACDRSPGQAFWRSGRRYDLHLVVKERGPRLPEFMPPRTDSLDGELVVDSIRGDAWVGRYTARLDSIGIGIHEYGQYDYQAAGRMWGDSFEVVIAPNLIDAQLPIYGVLRSTIGVGKWQWRYAARMGGTFQIRPIAGAFRSANHVLDSLVSTYPCRHGGIVTRAVTPLTAGQQCALVEAGIWAIASGRGVQSGARPSDSARIRGATITRFAFRDTAEDPRTTYWSIDYDVGDSTRTPTVHIDAVTGHIEIGQAPHP